MGGLFQPTLTLSMARDVGERVAWRLEDPDALAVDLLGPRLGPLRGRWLPTCFVERGPPRRPVGTRAPGRADGGGGAVTVGGSPAAGCDPEQPSGLARSWLGNRRLPA